MTEANARSRPVVARSLWLVGLLSALTLGLYNIYLAYRWSAEINALAARRYNPVVVLIVSAVSLGIAVTVYECFYAFDLQRVSEERGLELSALPPTILALNIPAFVLTLMGVLALVGLPLGVAATVLLQRRLNLLAAPPVTELAG